MRFFCVLLVLGFIAGCGSKGYEGAKRYPLSGTVTFNGEPVDGGIIRFIGESGTDKERPAGGVISGGKYEIPEGQGVNAGTYQVEIRWSKPTGKKIKDTGDTGEMIDVTQQVIPSKFNEVTELRAEVSGTSTTFDFDIKSN